MVKIIFIIFLLQCFLKMKPEHLTFSAANEKCVTFGGSLPSISDQADQGMVVNWGTSICSFSSRFRIVLLKNFSIHHRIFAGILGAF